MARRERPGLENIQDIIAPRRTELHQHAKMYKRLFDGKKVTYYFYSKGVPKRRTIYFYQRNFMHLCGVHKYEGGWKSYYQDCLRNRIKTHKVFSAKREYVGVKIDALGGLPKLIENGCVGFSDDAVVHKGTDYGEMVRTHGDMVALGTIEDRSTQNQVPISLINIEVSTDGMKKAISNWSKVSHIKVEPIETEELGMYEEERIRDKVMKEQAEQHKRENQERRRIRNEQKRKDNPPTTTTRPKGKATKKEPTRADKRNPNRSNSKTNQGMSKPKHKPNPSNKAKTEPNNTKPPKKEPRVNAPHKAPVQGKHITSGEPLVQQGTERGTGVLKKRNNRRRRRKPSQKKESVKQ